MEHLIMFNRSEFGLHHPGNIVPICKSCNKRGKRADNSYMSWQEQLESVCTEQGKSDLFSKRKEQIERHIRHEGYPDLTAEERHAIRVIASSLYGNVKAELNKSLELYRDLDEAFVKTDGVNSRV
jgi:hypothetical protein